MSLQQRIFGLMAVVGFAAVATRASGQCVDYGGFWAILAPTRCSPIDLQLRPYYIPRTPAWRPHDYRYNVKEPVPFCGCGPCCAIDVGSCPAGGCSYPPEAAAGLDPGEFENLGQIPNDSLLEGTVAPRTR